MKPPVSRPARRKVSARGFSLVVTIIMLALLMILVLGMTTLSTVSLKTASRDKELQRARSNARLALQLAIGELQALAGSDNRVTAPSSIIGKDAAQQHLTGVWEGWKWDGQGTTPDWEKEKSQRFKGWLVSSNVDGEAQGEDFAARLPAGRTVNLARRDEDGRGAVDAAVVAIGGQGKVKQGLAWAVFDESQKAAISLSAEEESDNYERKYDRMTVAHEPGYKAVKAFDWKELSAKKAQRRAMLTTGQAGLIGLKKKNIRFHDLSPGGYGLLTNVAEGGFAGDLSRLFDEETLPGDFASRFIYSGKDTPLVPPPARFEGANPLPSPDPSWALLHSHYRTFDRLSGSQGQVNMDLKSFENRSDPKKPMSGEQLLRNPAFNKQQIAPVIAKVQFVFSLTFGVSNTLDNMWKNGSARSSPASLRDNYITWLVIDPVVTLWNPYNVPLNFTESSIELYRIPMAFRLYKNGTRLSDNYTRLTDAHTVNNFKDRENKFYLLKLLPEKGKGNLLMQPGEHIVFTGHEWTKHGAHDYNKIGLTMRPGFNPPSGASSSIEIGGVTTQNLFVNVNGTSSGKDYGKTIRTVAVKGGDQIQVEVKPERAGADTMKETGGKEVTGFMKYYFGITKKDSDADRRLLGGIELDYGDKEKDLLPELGRHDLPTIVVNSAIPKTAPNSSTGDEDAGADMALRWKEPFLIATFQQKTERDSKFPSRSWVNNAPTNLYSSSGIDEHEGFAHQQYEFKWEAMTDWPPDSPTIEVSNERNRGYGGSGVYAQTGSEFATFSTIPFAPAHSLGQFSHAPLNAGGQLPLTTRVVGNSFAPPLVSDGKAIESVGSRTYLDHSYLANNALFDSWFLSTAANHPALPDSTARDAKGLLRNFFRNGGSLPNSRFKPYLGNTRPGELLDLLEKDKEAYKKIASHLLVEAPFNVNSTSVAAWQAVLASNFGGAVPLADGKLDEDDRLPVSRNLPSVGPSYESASSGGNERAKWTGYRRLSDDQIEKLAVEIVEEVKGRGPFQSLAEFVNRQPGNGKYSKNGPLQAAIERTGLNDVILDSELSFTGSTGANAAAGSGNTADGAPGVITQADLLTPILPVLTARGDTFVVRAYGEATGDDGRKITAWCEATVQRYPEYVDPSDQPTDTPSSAANKAFGRRFQLVSFRWLRPGDI